MVWLHRLAKKLQGSLFCQESTLWHWRYRGQRPHLALPCPSLPFPPSLSSFLPFVLSSMWVLNIWTQPGPCVCTVGTLRKLSHLPGSSVMEIFKWGRVFRLGKYLVSYSLWSVSRWTGIPWYSVGWLSPVSAEQEVHRYEGCWQALSGHGHFQTPCVKESNFLNEWITYPGQRLSSWLITHSCYGGDGVYTYISRLLCVSPKTIITL